MKEFDKYNKDSKYINDKLYEKNTPYALRNNNVFICWSWEWEENEKDPSKSKWNKIPKDAKTGKNARSNDDRTWTDFETACKAVDTYNFSGVGIMFGKGLIGIDLDDVVDSNGIDDAAKDIIQSVESYTELSPSGKGVHILAFADIPSSTRCNFKGKSFEIYSKGRFFTLTGKLIPEMYYKIKKKSETSPKVNDVYNTYFNRDGENKAARQAAMTALQFNLETDEIGSQGLNDKDIYDKCISQFERKKKDKKEPNKFEEIYNNGNWELYYASQSEADLALIGQLAFYTDSPAQVYRMFENSALIRDKWYRKTGTSSYGENQIKYCFSKTKTRYTNPVRTEVFDNER